MISHFDDCSCNSNQSLKLIRRIFCNRSNGNYYEEDFQSIDQSYRKIPIFYQLIKQIQLDEEFLVSIDEYLNRLKENIYNDLIRRETFLRNGKNHTRNLISLLRWICQISFEKSNNPTLDIMTAIDHILRSHFPQKKPLFSYILNEYISMWLHENLRTIEEDFSIMVEYGTRDNFSALCTCLFNKFQSICAINWERLQMIEYYRLTHCEQLLQLTNMELETNEEFIAIFGQPLQTTMRKSLIPRTSLYANRTKNELKNINEIEMIFRKRLTKILRIHRKETHPKMISSVQQKIGLPIETTTQNIRSPVEVLDKQSSVIDISTTMEINTVNPMNIVEEKYALNELTFSPMSNNSIRKSSDEKNKSPSDNHSLHERDLDESRTTDSKARLNAEINALINHLAKLTYSSFSSSIEQSKCCSKDGISSFRFESTRVLRTELEDTQILRDANSDHSNKSDQRLGSFPFITNNIHKLPTMNIDTTHALERNRVSIEIIHDPSRCSFNHPINDDGNSL